MDRATRLRLVADLDQRRAELREYWAYLMTQPRGAKILSRVSDTINDMIADETRSAEARLTALLADCGLIAFMLRRRDTDEPRIDPPDGGGQAGSADTEGR
jgi:hypothetical protein